MTTYICIRRIREIIEIFKYSNYSSRIQHILHDCGVRRLHLEIPRKLVTSGHHKAGIVPRGTSVLEVLSRD